MIIEYFHASKYGNGVKVAEEFKQQMAARGIMFGSSASVNRQLPDFGGASGPRVGPGTCFPLDNPWSVEYTPG